MKSSILISILVAVFTFSGKIVAQPLENQGKNSIVAFDNLSEFMNIASDLASDGSSLEFFGYTEGKGDFKKKDCQKVTKAEVVKYLDEIATTVALAGLENESIKPIFMAAKNEWRQLLGTSQYYKCSTTKSENMSFTVLTGFISAKYSVVFEFGYED